MTVTVFVWRAHLNRKEGFGAGHASLLVNHDYISWWPTPAGGPSPSRFGNALSSMHLRHKMSQDIKEEFGQAAFVSAPLRGLDEPRMERWAAALRTGIGQKKEFEQIDHYKLFSSNCAGLVLRGLLVGKNMEKGLLAFVMKLSAPLPRDCEYAARLLGG